MNVRDVNAFQVYFNPATSQPVRAAGSALQHPQPGGWQWQRRRAEPHLDLEGMNGSW